MHDMLAARERALTTARMRVETSPLPARPCHYCDRPTKGRARVGIPATVSFVWAAVCVDDRDRAWRSRDTVERLRDDRR